jgi:hypothetical protein
MENMVGQFPRNLSYKIAELSNFSKTTCKLTPDRTSVSKGETFRCKLPSNTIIDLSTLCLYAKGTCENLNTTGTTPYPNKVHFPRLTSSLIKTLSIYCNSVLIERIDSYNILYAKLNDLDGGGVGSDTKRNLEISDPSVRYTLNGVFDHTAGTPQITTLDATTSDVNRKIAITNWCGFLSTASTRCIDTNDFGVMEIEITLADEKVLWCSANNPAANPDIAPNVNANYKLDDIHFCISRVVFNSSIYYNMKASKLLSSGLQIAYQTYICSKGSVVDKSGAVNVNCTINSTSLDQLICTFNPENPSVNQLQLFGSNDGADSLCFSQASAGIASRKAVKGGTDFSTITMTIPTLEGQTSGNPYDNTAGDLFNQSYFFKSDAIGIASSSIEINNVPLMPQPMEDYEIYIESLIALGNNNVDMNASVHSGLRSLADFLKYYFAHIVSLENISNDGHFTKSGLDSKASGLNIVWKLAYNSGAISMKQAPYIYAKCTRVLQINEGHSVMVIV